MEQWKIKRSGAGMTITKARQANGVLVEEKFTDIVEVEFAGGRIIATDSNGAQVELETGTEAPAA